MAIGKVNGISGLLNADSIKIKDSKNIFNGNNVEEVLNELFTNAENSRKGISSVIGSPLSATDTLEAQKNKIQTLKDNFVNNLKQCNVSSSSSDSLQTMISKIPQCGGGAKSFKDVISIPENTEKFTHSDPYTNAHDDYYTDHDFTLYETYNKCNGFMIKPLGDNKEVVHASFSTAGKETFGCGDFILCDHFNNQLELDCRWHLYSEKSSYSKGDGACIYNILIITAADGTYYIDYYGSRGTSNSGAFQKTKIETAGKLDFSKGFKIYAKTSTSRGETAFYIKPSQLMIF